MSSTIIGGIDTTGWTEEQRAELRKVLGEETQAQAELNRMQLEANAPAKVIERKRLEAEEKRRLVEEEKAIQAAIAEHGADHIAVVKTTGGVIVLRTPTREEATELNERVAAAEKRGAKDEAETINLDGTLEAVIYPDEERVREILEKWPGVENRLGIAYVELYRGEVERFQGK